MPKSIVPCVLLVKELLTTGKLLGRLIIASHLYPGMVNGIRTIYPMDWIEGSA